MPFAKGMIPWNKGKHTGLVPKSAWTKGNTFIGPKKLPSGQAHWNWKGGKTRTREHNLTPEYNQWRFSVYRKFNWTCFVCQTKCTKNNIAAHHINPIADFPDQKLDPENGIVLCRSCHYKLHHSLKDLRRQIGNSPQRFMQVAFNILTS